MKREEEIKRIKQYLGERGIDKDLRIECNGGGVYLYNFLHDFYTTSRKDAKYKLIQFLKDVELD